MKTVDINYIIEKTMRLITASITGNGFIDDLIKIFIVIPLSILIGISTIVCGTIYLSVVTVYISFQHLTIIPIAFFILFVFI